MIVQTDVYTTSIRISAVLASDLSSKAISWFGAGKFSHIDVLLPDGWYYGARSDDPLGYGKGVQKRPPRYLDDMRIRKQWIIEVPCTAHEAAMFYEFLYAQDDKKYDFSAIFGFATGRNWREDDSWFCSELATAAGCYAGILADVEANKVTPGMCATLYQQAAYARGGKLSCPGPYVPSTERLPLAA